MDKLPVYLESFHWFDGQAAGFVSQAVTLESSYVSPVAELLISSFQPVTLSESLPIVVFVSRKVHRRIWSNEISFYTSRI